MVQPVYYPDPTTERIVGIGYRRSFFGRLMLQLLIETTHRHPSPWLAHIYTRTVTTRRDACTDDAPMVSQYLRHLQPDVSMHGGFVYRVPNRNPPPPPISCKPPAPPAPPSGTVRRECDPPDSFRSSKSWCR